MVRLASPWGCRREIEVLLSVSRGTNYSQIQTGGSVLDVLAADLQPSALQEGILSVSFRSYI